MGKSVTVAEVWEISLPNSALYTLDATVILNDAQFASLPAKYISDALIDISDADDPADPSDSTGLWTIAPANHQTGTTYTLQLSDQGCVVELDNVEAVTVDIPAGIFPVGALVELFQLGAGTVTIALDDDVTALSPGDAMSIADQYGTATLRQRALNIWAIAGDLG